MKQIGWVRGKLFWASVAILGFAALIVYSPTLTVTLFGDDYLFLETAGRSSFWDYLVLFFDPRVQTAWYRPMQGMRYGMIYALAGFNPLPYHFVNWIIHGVNCLLLYLVVWRATQNRRLAFLTALIFGGLALYSITVFWPGVADITMTLFLLASLLSWILFLQLGRLGTFSLAFIFFLLALMTKELAITFPIVLFVWDRVLIRRPADLRTLFKRYIPYLLIMPPYLLMEYVIQSHGVFINSFGYGLDSPLVSNFDLYMTSLAFPFGMPEPYNHIWLAAVVLLVLYLALARRTWTPVSLVGLAVLTTLPVIAFPWYLPRYLYVPVMVPAFFFAYLLDRALVFRDKWAPIGGVMALVLSLILVGEGLAVASSAADFNEIARQARVPFRDLVQRHSDYPAGTFLYFVDPLPQVAELSGMFFIRFGGRVSVGGNTGAAGPANLRSHPNSYVIYFDAQKGTQEIPVERDLMAKANVAQPSRLLGWELANDHAKRGGALALILYWDAPIEAQVKLVDARTGQAIADARGTTRGAVADARVLVVPPDAHAGQYRIEISAEEDSRKSVIEPILVSE